MADAGVDQQTDKKDKFIYLSLSFCSRRANVQQSRAPLLLFVLLRFGRTAPAGTALRGRCRAPLLPLGSHGHELLGRGRVEADGGVKLLLGGAALDSDRHALRVVDVEGNQWLVVSKLRALVLSAEAELNVRRWRCVPG